MAFCPENSISSVLSCNYQRSSLTQTKPLSYMFVFQTVFVIFYMMFAPLFGYLGDRYNRKIILCIGLTIWSFATFAGSFATNFWVFLFFRAVVRYFKNLLKYLTNEKFVLHRHASRNHNLSKQEFVRVQAESMS